MVKNSLHHFDAKEMYLHPKNRPVSIQNRREKVLYTSFSSVHTMPFPNCACYSSVLKIYRFKNLPAKMCGFRVNGRTIRHIFHLFQNVRASCERSLNYTAL